MSRLRGVLATRRGVVVLVLAAGGLLVLAVGRTWATGDVATATGATTVGVSGREAAPGAVAAALVVVAAALALTTAGRLVLRLAAGVLALGGAAVAVASIAAVRDPAGVLGGAAAAASGVRGAPVDDVTTTAWPWIAVVVGVAVVAAAVVVLRQAASWTAPRRFERAPVARPDERDRSMDAWDALSRGDDPT